MKSFELKMVDKIVDFFRDNYQIETLRKRVRLWNSVLSEKVPKSLLQPDIDLLGYNYLTQELIGIEVKMIYLTKKKQLNRKYYDGIGQTIALQNFGFDKVYFMQIFLVPLKPENERDKIIDSFFRYAQNIHRIINNSQLTIGYVPCFDFLWKRRLTNNHLKVIDVKDKSKSLLIKPKRNPLFKNKIDEPIIIREYLLEKYFK